MAPITNVEKLAEFQRLLDELERLICQQSEHQDGNFHDIIETMKVVPSKRDNKTLNAGRAARRSLLSELDPSGNESELKARTDNLIRLRASNEVIKRKQTAYYAALKGRIATDEEATQDFEGAKSMFGDAIKSRITSHNRQAQAQAATNRPSNRAQEANPQQAPQAQGTEGHEAPQPPDFADPKAGLLQEAADLKDRHARDRAELEDRLAQTDAQRQAQEGRNCEAKRQRQVQFDEAKPSPVNVA